MYFLSNTRAWLTEVIARSNESGLDPGTATFVLVTFTSLHREYTTYFADNREQISAFSGDNTHLFSPVIFDRSTVPDSELRVLRKQLTDAGIPISTTPAASLFRLAVNGLGEWVPTFFAAFEFEAFGEFERFLLRGVEALATNPNLDRRALEQVIEKRSLIQAAKSMSGELAETVKATVDKPRVFLSHSSNDKPIVREVMIHLAPTTNVWLDEREIVAGDSLKDRVLSGLRESDVLVVFLSRDAIASEWVKLEIAAFLGSKPTGRIIPVLLDATPDELPAPLSADLEARFYLDLKKLGPQGVAEGILRAATRRD